MMEFWIRFTALGNTWFMLADAPKLTLGLSQCAMRQCCFVCRAPLDF